jgi:hypothetical protein
LPKLTGSRKKGLGLLNVAWPVTVPEPVVRSNFLEGCDQALFALSYSAKPCQGQLCQSLPARYGDRQTIAMLDERSSAALVSLLHPACIAIAADIHQAPGSGRFPSRMGR